MGKLFKLSLWAGTYFGIPLYLHWSFLAFLAWHFYDSVLMGVVISAVFLCVTLHEYGHAVTGKYLGIETGAIYLLPVGGVALMDLNKATVWKEFWISIAGPAVNLGLMIVSIIIMWIFDWRVEETPEIGWRQNVWAISYLMFVLNSMLVLFNFVPAFPMDGGRVLRCCLRRWFDYVQATTIAVRLSQIFSVCFTAAGYWYGHWNWMFVGVLVFLMAQMEMTVCRKVMTRQIWAKIMEKLKSGDWSDDEIEQMAAKLDDERLQMLATLQKVRVLSDLPVLEIDEIEL